MYLSIIILPLLGSMVSGFFGRKVGVTGSRTLGCLSIKTTTILAIISFFEIGFNNNPISINIFKWLDNESFNMVWNFQFDSLTVYCVFISFIWYINAVLVKIQLYKVIFVYRFCTSEGWGLVHLNAESINRYQVKNLSMRPVNPLIDFSSKSLGAERATQSFVDFLQWFVGFSDAESNFFINPILKKDKVTISSFSFMFKIALHKDDLGVLKHIHSKLGVGNVRLYKNDCIFNVTNIEGIKLLISIFDKYNLNTTKHLDYLDFKQAFNLYINRDKNLRAELVKCTILELKNKMNTNRVNFNRPENSKIVITKSWLLGFIEGDGSFFLRRDSLTPVFYIEITGVQLEVLLKIKEFLEKSLGFNTYSLYKLKNSSIITVTTIKARNNSKSSVAITIKNVRILNNYLVPFLKDMLFLTKKSKDFQDFLIICRVVHNGAYRKDEIKRIILKLSYTMNNYRLSTHTAPGPSLSKEERDKLLSATPSILHLFDGRVKDLLTGKVIHQQTSCVYEIRELYGLILIANTLSEAAGIVGVYPDTLSKYLDVEIQSSVEHWVSLNNHKIRRVSVFN